MLRWIDADVCGAHRDGLSALLSDLPVQVRTEVIASNDDQALLALEPPTDETAPIRRVMRDFRSSGRPVAILRPKANTRPADLLIAAFDGLLSQLPDSVESTPFDEVLLGLLRRECLQAPERYRVWLQSALLNAAVARLYEADTSRVVTLFSEAMALGPVPSDLNRGHRMELVEALEEEESESGEGLIAKRRVQDWLLSK